ncbi:MAG TPA: phosphatase PAP2 family protein [Chthoniobacterales bacterium]|nr:phosphatase PAP2 family protein [Chthoniobacterales bacterium]
MKRSALFYWLIGIVIVAATITAAFYLDDAVRDFIASHQNPSVRNFMRNVSRFGDWPEHFALGLVLAGIAWWRGNKRWTRIFLSMLIALSIAGLAARAIKISTGRARPSVKAEQVWNGPRLSSKYHAFPSGHVVASTAFFAVLAFANWRIGLPCLAIPILIGFSRIYGGAHYLSDVICAAVLGILCALLVWRFALLKIENRKSAVEN